MALTFANLKHDLAGRGFSDLSDTRQSRYFNGARAELERMYLWPWREKSVAGMAPVTVTDLGVTERSETRPRTTASRRRSSATSWIATPTPQPRVAPSVY